MVNPEFRRNIWLVWSPHRAFLMSLVLGAIFLLTFTSTKVASSKAALAALSGVAIFGYVILVLFWGTQLVAKALIAEIHERTWDFQRMSSIGPWQMVWGKLFGSTILAWFGGGICLAVYVVAHLANAGELPLFWLAVWLGLGVMSQAFSYTTALLVLQGGGELKIKRSTGLLGAFMVLMLLSLVQASSNIKVAVGQIGWHGWNFPARAFVLASLYIFLAWLLLGTYRVMRKQLQFQNAPWIWLGFTLFLMVYVSGFLKGDHLNLASMMAPFKGQSMKLSISDFGRLVVAFEVGVLLTFAMAFIEPKNPVDFRLLFDSIEKQSWKGIAHTIPRWFLSFFASLAVLVLILLFPVGTQEGFERPLKWILLGQGAFLVRDIGVVLLLSFSTRIKRTDTMAFLYLVLLYVLIPGVMVSTFGQSAGAIELILALFWPFWCYKSVYIAFPVAEAGVVLGLCYARWQHTFSSENI